MKFRVLSFVLLVLLVLLAMPLIAQIPAGSCTPMSFSGTWANTTAYAKCAVALNSELALRVPAGEYQLAAVEHESELGVAGLAGWNLNPWVVQRRQ